jgi:hypothetical protein
MDDRIFPITPRTVRYIKLGQGGAWEKECREQNILRFGFASGEDETMALCRAGAWDALTESWQRARGSKGKGTENANEIRLFWTDPGDTLWITFIGDALHWGFLEPGEPQRYERPDPEEGSSYRRVRGGWRCVDRHGERLGKSNLPGFITKVAAYRGTSCGVERHDRLVARINGERTPDVERLISARDELLDALVPLLKSLNPIEFETLIDMLFTGAGWRRVGIVGRTAKDKDLDLEMPLTGERAFVQVKTGATAADLDAYTARLDEMQDYARMFFVYHSSATPLVAASKRVTVVDARGVAKMVFECGLVDWVVGKVY